MDVTAQNRPRKTVWWDDDGTLRFDQLTISPLNRMVSRDGDETHLTTMEFDLLLFLASHPGQVFTREELMHKVWDYITPVECSTVTVHILQAAGEGGGFNGETHVHQDGVGHRLKI